MFPNSVGGSAFTWEGTIYRSVQNMLPQAGYWLPISDSWFGDVAGYGIYEYTIHFGQQGWYMIGGVAEPVDFTDPNDLPDASILTPAFGYDSYSKSYYATDVIEPKQSYWIAVLRPCDLNIGGEPLGPSMLKPYTSSISQDEFNRTYGAVPPNPPNINWESGELIVVTIPTEFKLYQNYPNPFNPLTKIKLDLPKPSHVELIIYNLLGQKVKTLLDSELQSGSHLIQWDGNNDFNQSVSSGLYLCRMKAGNYRELKKVVLIR